MFVKSTGVEQEMVRKTKEEAQETRARLLDAAERVFLCRGVTRTSLAEIATAAGVTRGAVYWHFKDKADVFRAMCDRATLPMETMFDRAEDLARADPLATVRALSVGALQTLARDARAHAVFEVIFHKSEMVDELAGLATAHEVERKRCLLQVSGILRMAREAGQLPAETDVRLAAQGLHALIVGLMHEWVLDPSAYDLAAAAPALIDAYLAGLQACPPRRARRAAARAKARATA
jgi:TetR/AcrR family acrAB operon transcriptional repressor